MLSRTIRALDKICSLDVDPALLPTAGPVPVHDPNATGAHSSARLPIVTHGVGNPGRLSRAYLSLHFDSSTSPEEAVAFLESLPVPELDNLSFSASWIHSQVSLDYMFGAILHFSFLRSCHIGVRSGTWDSTGGLNEERSVLSPLYCLRYLEVLSMSCLHILRTPEELKQPGEAWPHLRKLRINSGAAPIPCGRIRLDDLLLIGQHFLFLGQATVELLPVEERWTWDRAAFDDAPECLAHLFVSNRSRISPAATTEVASFLARYFRYPSTCLQTLDANFEGFVDYRTVFRETLQLAH